MKKMYVPVRMGPHTENPSGCVGNPSLTGSLSLVFCGIVDRYCG